MPAQTAQTEVFPFGSHGLVLKQDPAQLQPGQFAELSNAESTLEGTINSRFGDQRLTDSTSYDGGALGGIHTISSIDTVLPARYLGGTNGHIYRSIAAIPTSGAGMTFTTVATGVGTTPYTEINFNGGNTGKDYAYFACPSAMLKDDGITFNPLEQWGIIPPTIPAIVALDAVTIIPDFEIFSGGTPRVNTTVSSATGTAPGIFTITPASMVEIINGMELTINAGFVVMAQGATATTFQAYCPVTPTGTITAGEVSTTAPTQFTTVTGLSIDASFNGVADNGYSTDDLAHIGVATTNANAITDFRLRFLVNGSLSDYYEKSISVSAIQPTVGQTSTSTAQLQSIYTTLASELSFNTYGPYGINQDLYQQLSQLTAYQLNPISSTSPTNIVWTEIDIPKSQFVSVGLAGQTNFTWKNVTGVQVYYAVSSGASATLWIGSVYFHGGFGPNAVGATQGANGTATPLLPYYYCYTFRNPVTGFESNPSPLMISANTISPQWQRVAVTITGTGDPQVSGDSSIAVYRQGGGYADGFYRHLGYVTNPGAGSTAVFYDSVTDISITGANSAEFDNDPPVTSTLPTPLIGNISGISPSGAANQLVTLTLTGAVTTGLTVASTITLHGQNQEVTVINSIVSSSQLKCYIQYSHAVGEQIEVDAITGQPCSLGTQALNAVYLAGDRNNRHVLYQSKIGRPEAFPIVNLETQVSQSINVGVPSDPIMAVVDFSGQLVCLNKSHIYIVPIFAGIMESPQVTPAERGLISSQAFCKTDNEIWFVSWDGIYSWNGGNAIKRSDAIDPLFKGVTVGNYPPISLTDSLEFGNLTMSYYQNEVRVSYLDTGGSCRQLRYNMIHDRWSIDWSYDTQAPSNPAIISAQYSEGFSGNLFAAKLVGSAAYLYLEENGTSDGWVDSITDGQEIRLAATPASYMLGGVSLNKQFADVVLDADNDGSAITVAAYYDYSSTPDATDTFSISAGSSQGRRRILMSLQNGFGKEAYTMTLRYSGSTTTLVTLYSIAFNYIVLTQIQSGRAFDWDDLGYPHDKRLYQMQIVYDIPAGHTETVTMDTITGIVGAQTINTAVQTFTLSAPSGTFTGPSHLTASFPINDEVIIKKVRIRPSVQSAFGFKIWGYTFEPFEKYPPDVMPFTEWNNFGYKYEKYAQQVVLDVNTNNVTATFSLYADGSGSSSANFNVTSTADDRIRIFTLPPNIMGKQFRLLASAGVGGKFQLFNATGDWLIWLPADKGPVSHTYDWDSLDYPYDKKLIRVTFEYNTSSNSTVMQMDTITGINGTTINTNAFQFTLSGPGRSLQTFEFPDDTYAKMIRFYPVSDQYQLQEWKYKFDKIDYPADITLFTDYSDFGWPCEKIARNLILVMNTGGVACSVALIADGTTLETFSVTSTIDNRIPMILACNSNLIGRLWKLEFTPGSGGQSQLFSWSLDYVKEPCAVTYYDSYETDMGYEGWKWLYQGWIHYQSPVSLTVTFYVENQTQFYQLTLPPQTYREMYRFYFPAITGSVLNKSRIYRMQISSQDVAYGFKLYADSRIEFGQIGADRRQSFGQFSLTAEQQNIVQSPLVHAGAPK